MNLLYGKVSRELFVWSHRAMSKMNKMGRADLFKDQEKGEEKTLNGNIGHNCCCR